jgi:hypothetical protein
VISVVSSLPFSVGKVISELTDPELALCRKDKGRAVELKGQGNACFSRRDFHQALGFYSQVIFRLNLVNCGS